MATLRTATIITILQELGDDDFKQFKWHLSEYKHIPYFQLEHSDRVDTSIKIKKTYGVERGLMFTMDLLKEMNMNDVVSRFSNTVSPPQTREAVTSDDEGETSGRRAAEWRPRLDAAIPEEMRASQLEMFRLMAVGLLCAIMGNILLVVATVTDNWLGSNWNESHFDNEGLWKACKDNKCYNIFTYIPYAASALQATGAFMILASISCFVGIIIGIKAFAPISPFRRYNRSLAAASLFFFSSLTLLMVMSIYTAAAHNSHKLSEWDPKDWYFSWSYKIGWAALLMVLCAASLYISTYGIHEKERKRRNRTQHGARNIFYIS